MIWTSMLHPMQSTVTSRAVFRLRCVTVGRSPAGATGCRRSVNASQEDNSTMTLSENYRSETIGRSDCRPIVRLSADTIVRWDYHPNHTNRYKAIKQLVLLKYWTYWYFCR